MYSYPLVKCKAISYIRLFWWMKKMFWLSAITITFWIIHILYWKAEKNLHSLDCNKEEKVCFIKSILLESGEVFNATRTLKTGTVGQHLWRIESQSSVYCCLIDMWYLVLKRFFFKITIVLFFSLLQFNKNNLITIVCRGCSCQDINKGWFFSPLNWIKAFFKQSRGW